MPTLTFNPPAPKRSPATILVDIDALRHLPGLIATLGTFDSLVIMCDAAVRDKASAIALALGDNITIIEVQSGEQSKTLGEVERITKLMLEAHATRRSLLIAVGGGMLTDLAGFVGSIYMRGISVVLMPTSLLGMVDAAIGGKNGVEIGQTKNILGTITHPRAIVCDVSALRTLPDQGLGEGLVEVIKMAAILDAESFEWIEKNVDALLQRDEKMLAACIERAVRMKIAVVEADERELGNRMFLNFGHTVGHALETLSGFEISHGQAVSIGMISEMMIAQTKELDAIRTLLLRIGMPLDIPKTFEAEKLWSAMQSDKKVAGGQVRIAVPHRLGEGKVRSITREDLSRLFP